MSNPHDLHCHSTYSDGQLSPDELLARAVGAGVGMLSITDHDTIEAYSQISSVPAELALIPGIEFSTTWGSKGVHILGLGIDVDSPVLEAAVASQAMARQQRAEEIGQKLEKHGIKNAFENSLRLSAGQAPGRVHFARHLVEVQVVANMREAFKKYLGDGKAGDVRQHWAPLDQIIEWIRQAGGIAVLAHPLKYQMTRTRLRRFLAEFIEYGGQGMEVISGKQQPFETSDMARLSTEFGLLASCGSDFHEPGRLWAELGRYEPLPQRCEPVWSRFQPHKAESNTSTMPLR